MIFVATNNTADPQVAAGLPSGGRITAGIGVETSISGVSDAIWQNSKAAVEVLADAGTISYELRPDTTTGDGGDRIYQHSVTVDGTNLTAAALTETVIDDYVFPNGAALLGYYLELDEEFVGDGTPSAALLTGGAGATFNLEPGQTLSLIVTDGAGAGTGVSDVATFDAAAGYQQTGAGVFSLRHGDSFDVTLDGGAPVTIVLDTADFVDITAATAAELAIVVDAALGGAYGTDQAGDLRITSLVRGTGSSVLIDNGVPAAAAEAVISGVWAATYNMAPGDTLLIDVDAAGANTVTWDAAAASITSTGETYDLTGPLTLNVQYDEGPVQAVDLSGVAVIGAVTATEIVNAIQPLVGGYATDLIGAVGVTSDTKGTGSRVRVTGTGAATIFVVSQDESGTGDVVNIDSVTIAEVAARIEADATSGGGVTVDTVGSVLDIHTVATGAAVTLEITGGTFRAGLGFALETTLGSGAVDTILNVDVAVAGTGDVVNIDSVTRAEVKTIVEADIAGVVVNIGGANLEIESDEVGAAITIENEAASTAVGLGFAVETETGTAGTNSTFTLDVGIGAGAESDILHDAVNCSAGAGTVRKFGSGTNALPNNSYDLGGKAVRVKADSNDVMSGLTAGSATAVVLYAVLP